MIKDVQAGLRAFLLADAAISTVVGGSRIHYVKLPNSVMPGPSIVINRVSEETDRLMTGPSGLVSSRFQIDCWASVYGDTEDLALKVKFRLNGYRGLMGSGSSLINVQGVFSENANPEFDPTSNLYRSGRDYFLNYDERV